MTCVLARPALYDSPGLAVSSQTWEDYDFNWINASSTGTESKPEYQRDKQSKSDSNTCKYEKETMHENCHLHAR